MQLGLLLDLSVGIKKMRHIVQLPVPSQHMGAPDNMDPVFPGEAGEHLPVSFSKVRQILNAECPALTVSNGH
ncbi:hypothetical protein D3C72_2530060 [compost metagenome]